MGRARCLGIPERQQKAYCITAVVPSSAFFKKVSSVSFAPGDGMVEQHSNSDKHKGKEWV